MGMAKLKIGDGRGERADALVGKVGRGRARQVEARRGECVEQHKEAQVTTRVKCELCLQTHM
jgi:hypothetical protein